MKFPSTISSEYVCLPYLEGQGNFDTGKENGNYHSIYGSGFMAFRVGGSGELSK